MEDSCIYISDDEDADVSIQVVADVSVQVVAEVRPDVIDLTEANKTLSDEAILEGCADANLLYDDDHDLESSQPPLSESDRSLFRTDSDDSDDDADDDDRNYGAQTPRLSQPQGPTQVYKKSPKPKTNNTELRLERERLKQQKQREKELERAQKEVNRANTASKANQNCTAVVGRDILKLIEDHDEANFKTLFEESSLNYELTDSPKYSNCITWKFKRAEFEDGSCVQKTKDTDLIVQIMDGGEYVRRISLYRDDPEHSDSLLNLILQLMENSQASVVIIVYKLSVYIRNEKQKEAKEFRTKFADRFRSGGGTNGNSNPGDKSNTNQINLDELRLLFQIDIDHNHPDWRVHIEFRERTVDVVSSIVRHTKSTAGREVKKKEKAMTTLDWAINMDKVKAIDPTRSDEDLTRLWIAQLQQFPQLTTPIAKTIAAEYPTPGALLDQYQTLTQDEAQDLLAELHVQRNLKRQVGRNISRRVYRFLTSSDPYKHIGID